MSMHILLWFVCFARAVDHGKVILAERKGEEGLREKRAICELGLEASRWMDGSR
jgi:hypothetical protein